ncbi:CAP domain-containing protein [Streptomyces sp. NPDC006487]|uniref:CAP domain-containing protein n=1 Tax=Streptomyces sp. NPDC006487 TaxID=3364748 RepID=UPI0036BC54B7
MSPRTARRRRAHRAPTPLRVKAALTGVGSLALAAACVAGMDLLRSPADVPATTAFGVPSSSAPPRTPSASAHTSSKPAVTPSRTASRAPSPKATPTASKAPAPNRSSKKPAPAPSKTPAKKTPAPPPDAGSQASGSASQASGSASRASGSSDAQEVVRLVNVERAAAGCPALKTDPVLTKAAQSYSDSMAATGNFSHTGSDGSQPKDRVEAAGYSWSQTGENIAMGQRDAAAVMDSWMNSPGHRANILNCSFTEIGVGINSGGGPWWTQSFGTPA